MADASNGSNTGGMEPAGASGLGAGNVAGRALSSDVQQSVTNFIPERAEGVLSTIVQSSGLVCVREMDTAVRNAMKQNLTLTERQKADRHVPAGENGNGIVVLEDTAEKLKSVHTHVNALQYANFMTNVLVPLLRSGFTIEEKLQLVKKRGYDKLTPAEQQDYRREFDEKFGKVLARRRETPSGLTGGAFLWSTTSGKANAVQNAFWVRVGSNKVFVYSQADMAVAYGASQLPPSLRLHTGDPYNVWRLLGHMELALKNILPVVPITHVHGDSKVMTKYMVALDDTVTAAEVEALSLPRLNDVLPALDPAMRHLALRQTVETTDAAYGVGHLLSDLQAHESSQSAAGASELTSRAAMIWPDKVTDKMSSSYKMQEQADMVLDTFRHLSAASSKEDLAPAPPVTHDGYVVSNDVLDGRVMGNVARVMYVLAPTFDFLRQTLAERNASPADIDAMFQGTWSVLEGMMPLVRELFCAAHASINMWLPEHYPTAKAVGENFLAVRQRHAAKASGEKLAEIVWPLVFIDVAKELVDAKRRWELTARFKFKIKHLVEIDANEQEHLWFQKFFADEVAKRDEKRAKAEKRKASKEAAVAEKKKQKDVDAEAAEKAVEEDAEYANEVDLLYRGMEKVYVETGEDGLKQALEAFLASKRREGDE